MRPSPRRATHRLRLRGQQVNASRSLVDHQGRAGASGTSHSPTGQSPAGRGEEARPPNKAVTCTSCSWTSYPQPVIRDEQAMVVRFERATLIPRRLLRSRRASIDRLWPALSASNLDAPRLRLLCDRQLERQHAVLVPCLDLIEIERVTDEKLAAVDALRPLVHD